MVIVKSAVQSFVVYRVGDLTSNTDYVDKGWDRDRG